MTQMCQQQTLNAKLKELCGSDPPRMERPKQAEIQNQGEPKHLGLGPY
jgi:hypothetical protein